jgi:restriction system protein
LTVPEYQTFMAPVLRALQDGQPRPIKEIREVVAGEMGITDDDRSEVIKSGVSVFDSRVGWAVTYMVQAGLVRRPSRAINQITERGQAVLRDHPERVDNHVLDQFEEFRDFKTRAKVTPERQDSTQAPKPQLVPSAAASTPTAPQGAPRETITAAVEENNAAVAADLLTRVREQDPAFLENLVLKVLTAMGYGGAAGSAERLGRSGDEGLDGVIKQDHWGSTASTSRRSATPLTARWAGRTSRVSSVHCMAPRPTAVSSSRPAASARTPTATPRRLLPASS